MQFINAMNEIERLRPTECDAKYSYLVRLRPDIKTKVWSLRGTGIKLTRGDNWVAINGRVANILLQYTERGYSWNDARFRREGRNLRPLVDLARNETEAKRIEQLYEIDRQQRMPGTAERPHDLGYRTNTPAAEEGLAEVERLLRLSATSPFDGRSEFAPSPLDTRATPAPAPAPKPAIPELTNPEPVDTDAGMSAVEAMLGLSDDKPTTQPAGVDAGAPKPDRPAKTAKPKKPNRPSAPSDRSDAE